MAVAVKELEAPDVVDAEVADATVPSTDNEATDRQPEPAKEEFDLTKNEAFRKWQAAQDRRVAALEQKYQRELEQTRLALKTKELSELDDFGQVEYKLKEAEAEREYLRQQLAAVQIDKERTNALRAIAQEASDLLDFSIPVDALQDAESPDQAWKLAASYKKQQLKTQAKSSEEAKRLKQEKVERNKVEVGSGTAPATTSKLDKRFKEARTTADLAKIWFNQEDD